MTKTKKPKLTPEQQDYVNQNLKPHFNWDGVMSDEDFYELYMDLRCIAGLDVFEELKNLLDVQREAAKMQRVLRASIPKY